MAGETSQRLVIPRHVGLIVDGNRRWAKERGLPTLQGHQRGFEVLNQVIEQLIDAGVEYVTAYVFSTENWQRSAEEVDYLMKLAGRLIKDRTDYCAKNQIRLRVLGTRERLSQKLIDQITKVEARTAEFNRATVGFCFNYGGHQEIADAVNQLVQSGAKPPYAPDDIARFLYAPDIPPVDLVVRTSGERRLSNFMLWRVSYSELLFVDKFWPDLALEDVTMILQEFNNRQRRFGK